MLNAEVGAGWEREEREEREERGRVVVFGVASAGKLPLYEPYSRHFCGGLKGSMRASYLPPWASTG
jgi:hypothetical protein